MSVCHGCFALFRSLEHSTIMYESDGLKPLLRLSWNKQDANYLATVGLDSNTTTILDIRCVRVCLCVFVCVCVCLCWS